MMIIIHKELEGGHHIKQLRLTMAISYNIIIQL
jgi:hypothetical protein